MERMLLLRLITIPQSVSIGTYCNICLKTEQTFLLTLRCRLSRFIDIGKLIRLPHDADNILQAEAVILVGSRIKEMALNCGYCGFPTCVEKQKHPEVPCAINMVDLGIAIGSMTAKAADLRIDCRVMFSAGLAAKRMGLMPECHSIYAIPISATSKNPFFDRQPKQ